MALLIDRALGEPPAAWHPVARFGQAMEALEGALWSDDRRRGVAYAAAGAAVAAAAGTVMTRTLEKLGTGPALAVVGATYVAVAQRALREAAGAVGAALDAGDLVAARRLLQHLVGRDTDRLDEGEIARAAVESVAENTVDAVTAPVLWALAGGAPAVLAHRAVNTLDAMVGHRSARYERFGWASARADDAANWLPARVTAAAVAAVRPRKAAAVWHAVRTQAPAHPSPNAGVVEAAFAAALGIRLGGVNDYGGRVEHRPRLGDGRPAVGGDIDRAVRLSRQATMAIAGAALAVEAPGWRP